MKPSRLPDISPRDRIGRVWERVMVAGFIVVVLLLAAGKFD